MLGDAYEYARGAGFGHNGNDELQQVLAGTHKVCDKYSEESHQSLTAILLKCIAMQLSFALIFFCACIPFGWLELVYTPPVCMTCTSHLDHNTIEEVFGSWVLGTLSRNQDLGYKSDIENGRMCHSSLTTL